MLKSNVLSDWLDISGLKNVSKDPTCKKGLPSLLDVLITNKPKRLQYISSKDIGTKFHVSKRKRTKIFYRSYKKFEETKFVHALSVAPFHVSEIYDEVDDAYWLCSTLLLEIVNEHAPIKQRVHRGMQETRMIWVGWPSSGTPGLRQSTQHQTGTCPVCLENSTRNKTHSSIIHCVNLSFISFLCKCEIMFVCAHACVCEPACTHVKTICYVSEIIKLSFADFIEEETASCVP